MIFYLMMKAQNNIIAKEENVFNLIFKISQEIIFL